MFILAIVLYVFLQTYREIINIVVWTFFTEVSDDLNDTWPNVSDDLNGTCPKVSDDLNDTCSNANDISTDRYSKVSDICNDCCSISLKIWKCDNG